MKMSRRVERTLLFLKHYGVALAVVALAAGMGVNELVGQRPGVALPRTEAEAFPHEREQGPLLPISQSTEVTSQDRHKQTAVRQPGTGDPVKALFEPTEKLTALLATLGSPLFAPELLESAARFLKEQEAALRAEGLLAPSLEFLEALGTHTTLLNTIRKVIERHDDAGWVAIERYFLYARDRQLQKLEANLGDDSRVRRLHSKIELIDTLSEELAKSINSL